MKQFSVVRSTTVAAPTATVHSLINDFHRWPQWSPWEQRDPAMERTHSGSHDGVGAHYAWSGNRKVGRGSMAITASTPERIDIDLHFVEPFRATNRTTFTLEEQDDVTVVTWSMTGERGAVMAALGRLYFDRAVVRDFEQGLARLKAVAES